MNTENRSLKAASKHQESGIKAKTFNFDAVLDSTATQTDVFSECGQPLAEAVLEGYNATLFAYGQTASGKTYTMMGDLQQKNTFAQASDPTPSDTKHSSSSVSSTTASSALPVCAGIVPRTLEFIFSSALTLRQSSQFIVRMSFFEIYRERVFDLLASTRACLRVRESPDKGIYVEGLVECVVTSAADVLELIASGNKIRSTASTNMNAYSSRSHCMLMVSVERRFLDTGRIGHGKFYLVDLAGSESINRTGATGLTLQEGKDINKSLSCLARVVHALSNNERYIPFRESTLTRVLQSSLGGNCFTTLLCALSPLAVNLAETVSSLRFASSAKNIVSTVRKNVVKHMAGLKQELHVLQAEFSQLKEYADSLEARLQLAQQQQDQEGAQSTAGISRHSSTESRTPSQQKEKDKLQEQVLQALSMLGGDGKASKFHQFLQNDDYDEGHDSGELPQAQSQPLAYGTDDDHDQLLQLGNAAGAARAEEKSSERQLVLELIRAFQLSTVSNPVQDDVCTREVGPLEHVLSAWHQQQQLAIEWNQHKTNTQEDWNEKFQSLMEALKSARTAAEHFRAQAGHASSFLYLILFFVSVCIRIYKYTGLSD